MRSSKKKACVATGLVLIAAAVSACGRANTEDDSAEVQEEIEVPVDETEGSEDIGDDSGSRRIESFAGESAQDAQIDFGALREKNPDIFAWLYIPETTIDCPVLQSGQSDAYYEEHNAYGEEDDSGAVYIELANLASMCDFNTVLHGKTGAEENGLFADLYRFANPDFFKNHEYAYLYLDGNVLTYEIFAAYERENTSLIRTYDFTYLSGCERFLDDLYGIRDMAMNLREGWENLSAYCYLITLTTQREADAENQFVVIGALVQDEAGTISRVVTE